MNDQTAKQTRILLIGDSISVQYGPYLQSALGKNISWIDRSDEAIQGALTNLDKPQDANSGDSARSLNRITRLLEAYTGQIDLILVNCGLHDIKTDPQTGEKQVSLEDYRKNVQQIVAITKQHNVPMIWIRTTLVNSSIHNSLCTGFHRFEKDVEDYNHAADSVMLETGTPAIDLWHFTRQLGTDDELFCDHVHYEIWARQFQGAYIGGYVQCYLDNKAKV
jgi:lysophospholipase L1-like esterase